MHARQRTGAASHADECIHGGRRTRVLKPAALSLSPGAPQRYPGQPPPRGKGAVRRGCGLQHVVTAGGCARPLRSGALIRLNAQNPGHARYGGERIDTEARRHTPKSRVLRAASGCWCPTSAEGRAWPAPERVTHRRLDRISSEHSHRASIHELHTPSGTSSERVGRRSP